MQNNKHTMFLMMALAVGGCAHDDDENEAPQSTTTSGAEDGTQSGPRRDADGDDIDDDADEAVDEGRRRDAARDAQQTNGSAPPAGTDASRTSGQDAGTPTTGHDAGTGTNGHDAGASAAPAGNAPTAQDQPVGDTDEDITLRIRRAIVADDSLSMAARNVTIITRAGVVTLRGTLSDRNERSAVEAHARAASGVRRVNNRIGN